MSISLRRLGLVFKGLNTLKGVCVLDAESLHHCLPRESESQERVFRIPVVLVLMEFRSVRAYDFILKYAYPAPGEPLSS